jgi:glycosyltransferase involved in cell wall biosynthesis
MNGRKVSSNRLGVSIIIPVYNGEKFIGECLESIAKQLYSNFECIIVDDGSTDRTIDVIQGVADSRFKIIEGEHKGSSAARNRGFLQASGQYVLFLDSDDVFQSNLLSSLYEAIDEHKVDVAICNYRKYDTINGNYSEKVLKEVDLPSEVFNAHDIPEQILNIFSGVPWNKLYRKDFLDKINITFLEDLVIGADSLFVHQTLLTADKIRFVDDILVDYRVNNPNSDVAKAKGYLADISRTVDELYAFIRKKEDYRLFVKSFDNWAIGKCLWIYSLNDSQIDPILIDIVKKYELNLRTKSYYYQLSARELVAQF